MRKAVKVGRDAGWHRYDTYGPPKGCPSTNQIANGDKVEVHWPDGTVERTEVAVVSRSEPACDMGREVTVPVREAYLVTTVHGQEVRIALYGTKIKIRKIP